jgi:hypothetical protein
MLIAGAAPRTERRRRTMDRWTLSHDRVIAARLRRASTDSRARIVRASRRATVGLVGDACVGARFSLSTFTLEEPLTTSQKPACRTTA